MSPFLTARRVTAALAGAAALGSAFTVGVVAGAGSEPALATAPSRPTTGVLDDAAAQIAGQGLHPVDRKTLDAAAINGMLRAAGDEWGAWSDRSTRGRALPAPAAVSTALESGGPGQSVGRVTVPSFTRGTGREVRAALSRLHAQHAAGVVLDLRGNPGGLLDEAVETASAFLDGGPVVTYTRRGGPPVALDALGAGDVATPLVVLVDGGTASAAEVVAGALQDRGRAVIVGTRTFGKGSVQEPWTLSDGSALQLTVARYRTPAGHSLEGVGLAPDIEIAPGSSATVAVRRALEVLTGLVADSSARIHR
ncbi:MAG: C-terminal processing peptidase-3 [Frankiales bacterium]|nr:C-terminal processing peptidase-3 [Frankiales bacterium]